MRRPLCLAAAALTCVLAAAGCRRDGCVGGDDGTCVPPPPCAALPPPACLTPPALGVARIGEETKRVAGPKSLAGRGRLRPRERPRPRRSGRARAPARPGSDGGRDPRPGAARQRTSGTDGDQTNTIYQAAGLLPRDAVHYETAEILDPGLPPSDPRAYRGGRFPRPSRGRRTGDRRDPLRGPPLRRRGARAQRPLQRRARAQHAVPDGRIFLGRQRAGAVRARQGDGLRPARPGPAAHRCRLADLAVRRGARTGLARDGLRGDLVRPHRSCRFHQHDPYGCRRSAGHHAAWRRLSLRAVHRGRPQRREPPRDRGHAGASAAGLAPAVAEALRVRSAVHGDPPAVTVTGRMVANGASRRQPGGAGRFAAVLRACLRTRPRRPDPPDALERSGASGGRQLRRRAAAQSRLPRATVRVRAARGPGQLVQRHDRRRRPFSDRRHLDHRLVAADRERRIVTRGAGQLRRGRRDSGRRSGRDGRAGAQPLQLVPGVRADAGAARRRLARLQPGADLQRAVRPAAPAGEVLRLRNPGPVRHARSRRGGPGARTGGPGHAAGRVARRPRCCPTA